MSYKARRIIVLYVLACVLTSCATSPVTDVPAASRPAESAGLPVTPAYSTAAIEVDEPTVAERLADQVVLGSGQFVQSATGPEKSVIAGDDGVTLNFERAEVQEFVKVIFETILHQNYIVDPSINGTVTLHTTRPITQDAVLPTVESVL
ncbi:MAG: hypothetical protein MUO51_16250, partial [Woeseiaceae bacterium]|nr:hypothetical protein [Woeseiaceae bacterium]